MWKVISIIAFVLVVGVGVKWVTDGAHVFSKDKQQVVVVDEMFGTESTEWKEGFWLGVDVAGPVAGVLIVVGIFGLYRTKKQNDL
jgi:hypothetical protein